MIEFYLLLWLVVTVLTVTHFTIVSRVQGILTLDGIFALSQWIMVTGTLVILDPRMGADNRYAWVIALPAAIYLFFSTLVFLGNRAKIDSPAVGVRSKTLVLTPSVGMVVLLLFSVLVTVAYFRAVGYNVLLLGLRGSDENLTDLRLESYGGSRYLFPGYVNQFKNTILPLLTVAIGAYLYVMRKPFRHVYAAFAGVGVVLAVMGTGQRGAFIQLALSVLTFLYLLDRTRFKRRAAIAAATTLPPVMFTTFLLGRRSEEVSSAGGSFGAVGVLVDELWNRVFYVNQFSGQMAFRYVDLQPTQMGREWLQGILGILPGNEGTSLPRAVFAFLYGSDRGTAPISMWGSVYHNFGIFGVVALAAILGVTFQIWTGRIMRRSQFNLLELLGISSFFVLLGNWVVGGPEYLLNTGLGAALFVWWLGARQPSDRAVGVVAQEPPKERSNRRNHVY